jgi:hypothetical protein
VFPEPGVRATGESIRRGLGVRTADLDRRQEVAALEARLMVGDHLDVKGEAKAIDAVLGAVDRRFAIRGRPAKHLRNAELAKMKWGRRKRRKRAPRSVGRRRPIPTNGRRGKKGRDRKGG